MSELAVKAIADIVLTAFVNGLGETIKVSDVMKAAHAAGHQISDADLAAYIVSGADSLIALHGINEARKTKQPA